MRMKGVIILILAFLNAGIAFSQQGDYFISHFSPQDNIDPSSNFDLHELPDGQIAVANRTGLLIFDGKTW